MGEKLRVAMLGVYPLDATQSMVVCKLHLLTLSED